jgi:GTP-binding protein
MTRPTVAIVGRPNVGKSSLFNRLLNKKLAVVDPTSGITRDRNYANCDWNGVHFSLVDTGGMVPDSSDLMERLIHDQSMFAIGEADLILFMVDTQTGITAEDQLITRELAAVRDRIIVVSNKADNPTLANDVYEFMRLGLGEPFSVSATAGLGIGELLDEIAKRLPPTPEIVPEPEDIIKIAVVGRPNVGKSSFINKLTGEDRLIVSDIAGTTRDAVDSMLDFDGQKYRLVDTAGLRRRYKVAENVEFYTTLRTSRAVDDCDIAVVLVDAADGLTSQDVRVLTEVLEKRRGAVLAINKWDTIEKDEKTADKFTQELKDQLAQQSYVPVIYISAKTGQRVEKVLTAAKRVYGEYTKRIQTSDINDFLQRTLGKKAPPAKQGKYIKFNFVTQSEIKPPTFVFFTNQPTLVDKGYISFLTNQIRERFGFEGVPIRLKFRRK